MPISGEKKDPNGVTLVTLVRPVCQPVCLPVLLPTTKSSSRTIHRHMKNVRENPAVRAIQSQPASIPLFVFTRKTNKLSLDRTLNHTPFSLFIVSSVYVSDHPPFVLFFVHIQLDVTVYSFKTLLPKCLFHDI